MAITYGFYNSMNGDRKYDAVQLSSIFDGVIRDGVFQSIGEYLATKPGTGMQVLVSPGKAWFDHTWTVNDALYPLDIKEPDLTLKRYDAVVLETDSSRPVRRNSIKIVQGTPSTAPQKPSMASEEFHHQHALAYVLVNPGATEIREKDIEIVVGKDECPFVTSILESVSIEVLLAKWEDEFQVWFDKLQSQMEGDIATNLQNQINKLDERVTPLESLGSRVETNTYNIAMLTLMHAKEGEFPPNTRKMIVCIPAISSNVLDYSGLQNDITEMRCHVLTKAAKIRTGYVRTLLIPELTEGRILQGPVFKYKKKQLYWTSRSITNGYEFELRMEDLYNRDPKERKVLHSFKAFRVGPRTFDFYQKDKDTLLIAAYISDNASSYSIQPVVYKLENDELVQVMTTSSKVGDDYNTLGCVLTDDAALYMYGTSGSNRGYASVLKSDGSFVSLGYNKGYTIHGYARTASGLYVHTGAGIKLFENYQLTDTNQSYEYGGLAAVFKNDVFFTTNGNYITKKTEKLAFSNIAVASRGQSFFVIGDELYFYGVKDGVRYVHKYNGTNFDDGVQAQTFYSELGLPAGYYLTEVYPVLSDGRNPSGASNTGSQTIQSYRILNENSHEKTGIMSLSFENLPAFDTVDLYTGGVLSNAKVSVSTNAETWIADGEPSAVNGERRSKISISGSGTLYVKIEFDLGSGYIDYIVGGVY